MQSFYFLAALVALSSAAPHLQDRHQNRPHRRRALLHEDLIALYKDTATATEVEPAAATATPVCYGPYCGSTHGGNTNGAKALVAASVTATGLMATQTATTDGSDLPDGWTIASAPRNVTQFSNSWYNATDSVEAESLNDSDDLDDLPAEMHAGVPSWAIALVSALSVLLLGGLLAFLYFRHRASKNAKASETDKSVPSPDADDALSSYKAFWELKRQSAGSFVSADATPAAIASDLVASAAALPPVYTSSPSSPTTTTTTTTGSTVGTPMTERAPPRGFLYQ